MLRNIQHITNVPYVNDVTVVLTQSENEINLLKDDR